MFILSYIAHTTIFNNYNIIIYRDIKPQSRLNVTSYEVTAKL